MIIRYKKPNLFTLLKPIALYDRISQQTNIESEQDHVLNQAEYSDGARETKITKPEDESNKECDDRIRLSPRPPQLLPIEQEVNLRHQELEARKNPEEWMVDYAMRQAVKKGNNSTASQSKVELIVQAFETVVPKTRTLSTH